MATTANANAPISSSSSSHDLSTKVNDQKTNRVAYADTWAKDIQMYHAAKSVLPWIPGQEQPVKYVTRHEKSREEREYDVVLGRYRDDRKEFSQQQRESLKRLHDLEKGRAKQLRTAQHFNVINNESMHCGPNDLTPKQSMTQPFRTKHVTEYNIVTNVPHNGVNVPNTGPTPSKPQRDFNILTNEYHDLHDVKLKQEVAQAKRLAAQKYFKSRTFDPVRITFVDEDREKDFLLQRIAQQQRHGMNRVQLLPPREQCSEGRLYNILDQRVIDSEKLATMDKKTQRSLNRIKKTAFEAKMREAGSSQQARDTDLCLNRFAHERYAEKRIHGYDVLSHEPYAGRAAKPLVPPRTHPALTAWQPMESGLLVGNRVAPSTLTKVNSIKTPSTMQVDRDSAAEANILNLDNSLSSIQGPVQGPCHHQSLTKAHVRTGGFRVE